MRIGFGAGHAQGQAIQLALVPIDELRERGAVALLRAFHQLPIAGLAVGTRLFGSELGLLRLRRIGQGRGTLEHAGMGVKGRGVSFRD